MMVTVWLAINEKYKIKICKCVMINAVQVNVIDNSISAVLPYIDLNSLDKKRLFITGGTGFFGLWLLSVLRILNQKKVSIEVCVLSRNPATFQSLYPQFLNQSWLSFISGDVKSFKIPETQFDFVLHAATETSISAHANPIQLFDDIVLGTRQVLKLAQQCNARRILLISSGAVYGQQPSSLTHLPDESQLACNPLRTSSAYGEGKRVMELMGAMLHESTGIESISARCFAFCGPGLALDGYFAIGNFIRDALYKDNITVRGDGSPMRSYLYGADLAVWLLNILTHGKAGSSYNVGSDKAISVKDLAFRVRDVVAPHKLVEVQGGEISMSSRQRYVPDISRALKLGCLPWTTLDESILLTAKYWQ